MTRRLVISHRFINRLRWPGALLIGLLALGGALGIALGLIFDPPFLTWQHAAELAPALEAYAAEHLSGLGAARIERVRAYSPTCSIIRASVRQQAGRPLRFWALLYRDATAWQVFQVVAEGRPHSALLAWGDLCAEETPPLPPRELWP